MDPAYLSHDGLPNAHALLPCGNANAYSPKCRGRSCPFLTILPGANNDFFLTRIRRRGDVALGTSGNNQNYTANEEAEIYFPGPGRLTVLAMDVEQGGGDYLKCAWTNEYWVDLATKPVGFVQEVLLGQTQGLSWYGNLQYSHRVLRWKTDFSGGGAGWTLYYEPWYPSAVVDSQVGVGVWNKWSSQAQRSWGCLMT